MQELLEFILAQHLSDSSSPNKTYRICTLGNSRLNCLKTIPFKAADTYIAHIWQYPPPPRVFAAFTHMLQDHNWQKNRNGLYYLEIGTQDWYVEPFNSVPLNVNFKKLTVSYKKSSLINYQPTTLNKNKKINLHTLVASCKKNIV